MVVKTIAVIGASEMGRRIAYAAASAGYETILEDAAPTKLDQAIAWIAQTFYDGVARGMVEARFRDAALRNIATARTVEDAIREADLIIETLPDELEMKIELFTLFDKFAKPKAVFASNTSTFSITDLAAATVCTERCIGMRFGIAPETEALELVKGLETSEETIATCSAVGRRMGKEVVVVHESDRMAGDRGELKSAGARG